MTTSLADRVARTTALSVALAGILVAASAALLADRLVSGEEDTRLREAARTFADELISFGDESPAHAGEEATEFLEVAIHLAAFSGGRFVAGERELPRVAPGRCTTVRGMRMCGGRRGRWTTVAASSVHPFDRMRATFGLAALFAVLGTTFLGWLFGREAARWTLAPLERLRAAAGSAGQDPRAFRAAAPPSNVAEVDALREDLVDAFDRLDAAIARTRRFASDAAHELRTPLTSILGELELLADDRREDVELVNVVARTRRSANRLATLVERLLALATPNERLRVTEVVDLREVVEDAVLALPEAQRARVTMIGVGHVAVQGDAPLLVLSVVNGLDNALKYSGDAAVTIRISHEQGVASITIDDDGPGVAPADRERVFEPFARVNGEREAGVRGHGIGLALVAHVMAVHGGGARFLDVERGARLRVEIPCAPESHAG